MNKLLSPFLFLLLFLFSCNTIDVEKLVEPAVDSGAQELLEERGAESGSGIIIVPVEQEPLPAETVYIEKPVYIPQGEKLSSPPEGRAAVEAANRGIVEPKDYENAAMLYDYHRDFVYELYCRPLRVSDITLQAGEKAEQPFISDSERWMLGAGVSYENGTAVQHIYVKPKEAGLEATLIINTSLRVYHLVLRSFSAVHMPIVRWRYHSTDMPQNYIQSPSGTALPLPGTGAELEAEVDDSSSYIDPRFLSFNYVITHGIFQKPRWLPTLAYDDGKKTYITFPESALQTELPTVFENRSSVINYRVMQNVIVIDKLIEKITIKLGNNQVTVEKKRGEAQ